MYKWTIWLALVLITPIVSAQVTTDSDQDLNQIDVVENLGQKIPLDLNFVDDHGDSVSLAQYFNHDKPVILVLGYYRCPMLCNLVFNAVVDGVNQLDWTPGDKFQIVTVSINPEETPELAAAKKANYLSSFDKPVDESSWMFLVGAGSQSKALADAVGFKYFYDEERDEYAHPAVAFVLTPDGVISRYLYGIQFTKTDLKLSLLEASEGKIGSPLDRVLLYCYHYDPDARGYGVVAANVMKVGGAVTLAALGLFLSLLWYGEKLRRRRAAARAEAREQVRERV